MHKALAPHHLIFTPENPKHKSKFATNPSIEDVTKFLNDSGEDAQIVNGFYDGPERSILVQNPKNIPGMMQMATDFGQESVLHSDKGSHKLHYVNGPEKGKIVTGQGTHFLKEKPANHFTEVHTVDGPLYVQHNLNFDESTQKSEHLQKAPLRYDSYTQESMDNSKENGLPDLVNSERHQQMKHVKLPNGLEYRQFRPSSKLHHQVPRSRVTHALYHPSNPHEPLAYMETQHEEDPMAENGLHSNVVQWSEVAPEHRGKGLGRQLYLAGLIHGAGQITSGANVSPSAHSAWKSFRSVPGIGGRIARYPKSTADHFMSPSEAASYEADRHHVFVRDKSKLDMNQMFPAVSMETKMAASEDMKKSIASLEDIRAKLEDANSDEKVSIPEHLVMQWSVPSHRWTK